VNRIALVTGAAGDIGRATSRVLAAAGWSLALTDHPAAALGLDETHQLMLASGARVWSSVCDVTDDEAVASMVASCVSAVGVPSGLFNNAGYQGLFVALPGYPPDDLRKVLEVNVIGVFQVMQHVAKAMIGGGVAGAIVNTASMAGVGGAPNMPAYSASKAAVIGLTKSAAKDLAPSGIRVNAISPAFIGPGKMWDNQVTSQAATKSQYYAHEPDDVARQMIAMVPLRRYGSVDEVAAVVEFLLSDKASYVTGQNIEVTGGSA
jgi:NAD(P)-dependent dehydrogenase (short-subunit alcohol dehydrogenase family)